MGSGLARWQLYVRASRFDQIVPPGVSSLDDASPGATAPTLAGRLHNLSPYRSSPASPSRPWPSAATAVRSRDYRWAGYSAASGLAMVGSFVMFGIAFGDGSPPSRQGWDLSAAIDRMRVRLAHRPLAATPLLPCPLTRQGLLVAWAARARRPENPR